MWVTQNSFVDATKVQRFNKSSQLRKTNFIQLGISTTGYRCDDVDSKATTFSVLANTHSIHI